MVPPKTRVLLLQNSSSNNTSSSKTKSVQAEVTKSMHGEDMNECQIYQLLRDMEAIDENGDFLWEEQQDDNTEPMHIFEDEEKIFDPEGSLSNQKEFVLP